MKKYMVLAIVVVAVLAAGIPLAVIHLPSLGANEVTAQSAAESTTDELQPLASESQPQRDIIAEAVVVPVRFATLSMGASGVVAALLVAEGDMVQEGQPLIRLQDAHQQAAVAQAQAALASAQAQLSGLEAGARTQEIAAAQASLDAARAGLARLEDGAREQEIAAGRASLDAAKATLQRLYDGPDEFTKIAAAAELANAEAALRQAQAAYDRVSSRPEILMLPQSLQLEQATNGYEAAKASYDALFDPPDADRVAQAKAQVEQAEATLERLLQPATDNEIAEAGAMVRQAEARLELLQAGARTEEISAAEAAVAQAAAALQQAEASLADTVLQAPFDGTLAAIHVKEGEQVGAGMSVAQLADLMTWQVETDDLTELDIVRVQPGDRLVLTFDAIEGLELSGTVERIKTIGEEKRGDVTYTVVIQPDEQDARLRWGMTAIVTIAQ